MKKKKSFTDECLAAKKKEREEANDDDGIDYKDLYFKELKKKNERNERKRYIDDIYDGDDKKESDRKRARKSDEFDGKSVSGEHHGKYYIENGICYKESDEDQANKDGFYIYRDGKYYKRLEE